MVESDRSNSGDTWSCCNQLNGRRIHPLGAISICSHVPILLLRRRVYPDSLGGPATQRVGGCVFSRSCRGRCRRSQLLPPQLLRRCVESGAAVSPRVHRQSPRESGRVFPSGLLRHSEAWALQPGRLWRCPPPPGPSAMRVRSHGLPSRGQGARPYMLAHDPAEDTQFVRQLGRYSRTQLHTRTSDCVHDPHRCPSLQAPCTAPPPAACSPCRRPRPSRASHSALWLSWQTLPCASGCCTSSTSSGRGRLTPTRPLSSAPTTSPGTTTPLALFSLAACAPACGRTVA